MKKYISLFLALLMVLSLFTACSANDAKEPVKNEGATASDAAANAEERTGGSESADDEDFLVGLTLMFYDDPYFLDMRNTVKDYCDEHGWGFTEFDAASDAANQCDAIENMIASGIDALVLAAVDSSAVIPVIEKCNKQGIPVFCVDAGVDGGEIVTLCESDNYEAGVLCGEAMVEKIGGSGQICITNSPSGAAARLREEGFRSVIEQYPEIEVMDTQESVNQTRGMEIGDTWAIAYPELAAVFSIDDNSGLGVASAFANAGLFVPIYSVDGSSTAAEQIKDPNMMYAGTAAQQPILIAMYAMEAINAWKNGEKDTIDPHIQVPVFMVNEENAQAYLDGELTQYDVAR